MSRANKTLQHPKHDATPVTYSAPTGSGSGNGWSFPNTAQPVVHVVNTDTDPKTLTLKANGPEVGGIALSDKTATVPAADESGPGSVLLKLPKAYFGDTALIDVDDATGVTLAVFN